MTSPSRKVIHLIAAARPNFMKIAPLFHALKKTEWATPFIVHTGQHYDLNMSDVFFQDLGLPEPDLHLGIPCLTLRPNTERPITVTQGTNQLCTLGDAEERVSDILAGEARKGGTIELWDGQTSDRVVAFAKALLGA